MVRSVLLVAFALFNNPVLVSAKHGKLSLVTNDAQAANTSLVKDTLELPRLAIPMDFYSPWEGDGPDQWRMPKIFKRQGCSSSNYCGSSKSTLSYCPCNEQCCQVSCCINGATCNGNGCAFKTVVTSVYATLIQTVFKDITITTTAAGGTVTITSSLSSVAVVTVSSADIATIISFTTVTAAAKYRARDLRPADIAEQPLETSTAAVSPLHIQSHEDDLAPRITDFPSPPEHLEKRQTIFVSTIRSTIGTSTVVTTTTRLTTTTIAVRVTATYYTTFWRTITTVSNAKRTTTIMSTITLTPDVRSVTINNIVTTVLDNGVTTTLNDVVSPTPNNGAISTPGSTNNNGNNNNNNNNGASNNPPDQAPTKKGLSTGAQAGIGAGTAGGSLIICIILGFFFWRRRKSRKERDREMIDTAVTSAMAARDSHPPPPSQYYDGKQLSTATTSPHPYSLTPPLHSPQPSYVYPPPAPMYNHQGPMEFPESGVDPRAQYRYSVPAYGGSEIDGNAVQRYELQQFSSPPPPQAAPYSDVPHPGPYTEQGRAGVQRGYSDLPEVRASDLPEVRR